MTLTELRYITAVAREKHFGKAAEACFVSQPTLSVAVKKLEDELDVALFERHQHEIHITDVGKKIIAQAQTVLEAAEEIKQISLESKNELSGELRLGTIYTIGPYLLPKIIASINQMAPELTLLIEEDYTKNLADKLRQGELDAVIVSTPFDEPAVDTINLYSEPFTVVLPKGHTLTTKKKLKLEELFDESLLLLKSGNCFRDQVLNACMSCQGVELSKTQMQKTLEGSSIETIRQMVAAGVGITVLPCTSINPNDDMKNLLEYRELTKPTPEREVILAYRKSYPRTLIINLLQTVVNKAKLNNVTKAN